MKRGQITVFVIIGLAVLIIAGLVFLLQQPSAPESLAAQQDVAKVTQFVQGCLAASGERTLREIGKHGGYLDTVGFKNTPDHNSQVVTLPPQEVVLWNEVHPCSENGFGCYASNRPSLCRDDQDCPRAYAGAHATMPSIEEQLETGTVPLLLECLDFTVLPDVEVRPSGKPEIDAIIRENDVLLTLEYPLTITTREGTTRAEEYTASLPVRLPMVYELATKIQQGHNELSFIEKAFTHLLAIYSGADTPIPPMREVHLFGGQRTWVRSQVEQDIEEGILPFMNFLQLFNAEESYAAILPPEDTDPTYYSYAQGAYQYLTIRLDNTSYPLSATFEYPNTGMYLDINGRQLLKPQKMSGGGFLADLTGLLFIQYKFAYTAAFPLLVKVSDPEAFNGQGYQFTFGLEANIYKNYPLDVNADFTQLSATGATIDIASEEQLVNHLYTITVRDRNTDAPIQGISVEYECGTRFTMGLTGADGMWTGRLPYCINGAVVFESEKYLGEGQQVSNINEDGARSSLEFKLWPRQKKQVVMYKRTPTDAAAISASGLTFEAFRDQKTNLTIDNFAFVVIDRRKESAYQDDVPLAAGMQFGLQKPTDIATLRQQLDTLLAEGTITQAEYDQALAIQQEQQMVHSQTIDLVPGEYDLEATLMHTALIMIPAASVEGTTLPATNLTSWVSGGAILKGDSPFTLDAAFVYSDAPLVLFVLEQPLPVTWTELQNYQSIEDYQTYDRKQMVIPLCGDRLCT